MDMLYSRYSNPWDLMRTYIERGRFGEFVKGFLQAENDRRKQEAERDEDLKLWIAYVHSYSDKSFSDWKNDLLSRSRSKKRTGGDYDLDDQGIKSIIGNLFPNG